MREMHYANGFLLCRDDDRWPYSHYELLNEQAAAHSFFFNGESVALLV